MEIFWIGFPGPCGGANVEAWHTAKLLQANGVTVNWVPTAGADMSVKPRLEAIGSKVILGPDDKPYPPAGVGDIPGIKNSVVVSMCNSHFIKGASQFRDLGCKIVWVNCMTFLEQDELRHYKQYGKPFDAYVFQSRWQRSKITPILEKYGFNPEQGHLIRGAFAVEDWPFEPLQHKPGEKFVIGRISRHDPDKFSSNTWAIYGKAQKALAKTCPVKCRVMAWHKKTQERCGMPQKQQLEADLLASCAEPSDEFMRSLHCYCQVNGGAGENWPRSGLEAMATGVPLVVQDQWGWQEMIEHGKTGFLVSNDCHDQFGFYMARLATDEDFRLEIAANARKKLVEEHANPGIIWAGWKAILEKLS